MMIRADDRYNRLFRQTHKTFQIHHLTLLMFKDYITILVSTLQRIHRQYISYESALDDTLIRIKNLNLGYLTHHILDPKILGKYLESVQDDLEETAPEFEPVFTSVYTQARVTQNFKCGNFILIKVIFGHFHCKGV